MSTDKVSKDSLSFNQYIKQLRDSDAQDNNIDGRNKNEDLFGDKTLDKIIEYDKQDDGEVNGSIFDGKKDENKEFTDYINNINETKEKDDIKDLGENYKQSAMFPPIRANMSFADVEQYLDFLFDGGSKERTDFVSTPNHISKLNAYTMLFSPEMLEKKGIKNLSEGDEYFRGANYGQMPAIKDDYTKSGGQKIFNGGAKITSPFGMRENPIKGGAQMHNGIDIALTQGTDLKSPFKGVVRFAGEQSGYGNLVIIDHGDGKETRYAHLSQINVKPGQEINTGDSFAKSGGAVGTKGAGSSTGAHLHLEYRENGKAKDPLKSCLKDYLV